MNEMLNRIIMTLNTINVHGTEDLSKMLGCIQELEKLIKNEENN